MKNVRNSLLFTLILLVFLASAIGVSALGQAIGKNVATSYTIAQALGRIYNYGGIRSHRAYIWVPPAIPNNLEWTASPIGICFDFPCDPLGGSKFIETGFIKGVQHDLNNEIHQYVTYLNTSGGIGSDFDVGSSLNPATWYQMRVHYSNSEQRWEVWRGNSIPWHQPNLGWTSGKDAASGAENAILGGWMDVYVYMPEYKSPSGSSWIPYNYSYTTLNHGCINRAYSYGHRAYDC